MWACELRPVASRQRLLSCLHLLNDHCMYIELCGEALGVEKKNTVSLARCQTRASEAGTVEEELLLDGHPRRVFTWYVSTTALRSTSRLPYVPGAASSGTPCGVQDRRSKFERPDDPKRRSSVSVSLSLPSFPTLTTCSIYTDLCCDCAVLTVSRDLSSLRPRFDSTSVVERTR